MSADDLYSLDTRASGRFATRLGSPQSIVILRALKLGDMLCAVPAFRSLRAAFPKARIVLVGLPWAQEFVHRFHSYLDDLIVFPGYPGLPESPVQGDLFPGFFSSIRNQRFDLAIQMHGSGSVTNPLVALFGAKTCAGFFQPKTPCPNTGWFLPYPSEGTETNRLLRLMSFLDVPLQGDHLEFPFFEKDGHFLEALEETWGLSAGEYVCLHPGASRPVQRWFPERFADVADGLAAQGLKVVLTGSKAEEEVVQSVMRAMKSPAVSLAGRTDLGGLAALLHGARLLVCNDTGVSHLAAALRVPSVVLFLSGDRARWAPADNALHRVLSHPMDCRPCGYTTCPIGHPCADGITADQVLKAAGSLLHRERVLV